MFDNFVLTSMLKPLVIDAIIIRDPIPMANPIMLSIVENEIKLKL
jgi:hypothetical protein